MAVVDPGLPPEEAIRAFRAKGYAVGFSWRDIYAGEHAGAFTVAKMMRLDLLADVRAAVDKALAAGTTFEDFRKELEPLLIKEGWWGKKEMIDPKTGETHKVQLGSPRRLRTIFETNLRVSYAAGDWERIQSVKKSRPYLRYSAVQDEETRPAHAAWHGTILPVDDPWWKTHAPPNAWRCRCWLIQLSESQMERRGWKPSERPEVTKRTWFNKRIGETRQVPVGIDPGWDYNPGDAAARRTEMSRLLAERLERDLQARVGKLARTQADYDRVWADARKVTTMQGDRIHRADPAYVSEGRIGAAGDYIADGYRAINRRLKAGKKLTGRDAAVVEQMTALAEGVGGRSLWRGIRKTNIAYPARPGERVEVKAVLSTSVSIRKAFSFAEDAIMQIHTAPGAVGVVWNGGEREVTLLPGHYLRVIRVHRRRHNGQMLRTITAVAEPPEPKTRAANTARHGIMEVMAANEDPRLADDLAPATRARWESEDEAGGIIVNEDGTAKDPREQELLDKVHAAHAAIYRR